MAIDVREASITQNYQGNLLTSIKNRQMAKKVNQDKHVNLRLGQGTDNLVSALAKENGIKKSAAYREIIHVGLNEILKPKQ